MNPNLKIPVQTAKEALFLLKEGNQRFFNSKSFCKNFTEILPQTAQSQQPFALILSCMDSRVPIEIIFDQNLGHLLGIRIAGNVLNADILGSMEFACQCLECPLIFVLGHTQCGAMQGACDGLLLENLTPLLEKIQPALLHETTISENRTSNNSVFVNRVAHLHVKNTMHEITQQSRLLKHLQREGKIDISGGMYHLENGKVNFFD